MYEFSREGEGGKGYFPKFWVGVCEPPLETRTLFQAKKCDFPYSFSDLTQNSISHFRPTNSRCYWECTSLEMILIKSSSFPKTVPNFRPKRTKIPYLRPTWSTSIPYFRPKQLENLSLCRPLEPHIRSYLTTLYKEVRPQGVFMETALAIFRRLLISDPTPLSPSTTACTAPIPTEN